MYIYMQHIYNIYVYICNIYIYNIYVKPTQTKVYLILASQENILSNVTDGRTGLKMGKNIPRYIFYPFC